MWGLFSTPIPSFGLDNNSPKIVPTMQCCSIYKSGPRVGTNCNNAAKWLKVENGVLMHVCGIHSKQGSRIPYVKSSQESVNLSPTPIQGAFPSLSPALSSSGISTSDGPPQNSTRGNMEGVERIVATLPKEWIGSGSHSEVYSVKINGKSKALKVFKVGPTYTAISRRELYVLKIINSDYIVKPDLADSYGMIMDLGSPLRNVIRGWMHRNDAMYMGGMIQPMEETPQMGTVRQLGTSESLTRSWIFDSGTVTKMGEITTLSQNYLDFFLRVGVDICQALSYLHSLNMVHMDLKPGNVVLFKLPSDNTTTTYRAKLIDFGGCLSVLQQDEHRKTHTATYSSPEFLLQKSNCISTAYDIWSFGVILYSVVYGHHPYIHHICDNTSHAAREQLREQFRILDFGGNTSPEKLATPSSSTSGLDTPSCLDIAWGDTSQYISSLSPLTKSRDTTTVSKMQMDEDDSDYSSRCDQGTENGDSRGGKNEGDYPGLKDLMKATLAWKPQSRISASELLLSLGTMV